MAHTKVIHEMREDCECSACSYCPLEVLIRSFNDRLLEQHKCVEKFKMEESDRKREMVTWDKAYTLWVERGHAKIFAELYNESIPFKSLYSTIMKGGSDVKI